MATGSAKQRVRRGGKEGKGGGEKNGLGAELTI